jgi:hypothetical protein
MARIIMIEDKIYKCSNLIFRKIKSKQEQISNNALNGYWDHPDDREFKDFLDSLIPKMKEIGVLEFQWQL